VIKRIVPLTAIVALIAVATSLGVFQHPTAPAITLRTVRGQDAVYQGGACIATTLSRSRGRR